MNRIEKIALPVTVLLLCASACMHVLAAYIGDKTWLLLATGMWMNGKRLYVDIMEVNPPLILWLYAVPVWISAHLPFLKDYQVLGLMGLGFCAVCIWLCGQLIRLHPAFAEDARNRMHFMLLLALVFVFFTRPVYFFDREHIFFVLTFPYMLRFMPSLARKQTGWRISVCIGLLAALGFCIKPYTIIVFTALQLLVILRERSLAILWSLENRIIYAFALLYLACVWYFTPEYIRVVLPMAFATYSAFNRRAMGIFYCIMAFGTAGLTFADFRPRFITPYRRDIYYFAGVSLAFLAYALANNGWGYTYHPLLSQLLFLAGWVWEEYNWLKREHESKGESTRQFVFGQRACAITLLGNAAFITWCIAWFYVTPACEWSTDCQKTMPYVRYLRDHNIHSFGALSEDWHKWASLARLSGAGFDTRYNALWMVPKLVLEGKEFTLDHQWIVVEVGRGLAEDLTVRKPQVVFVDDSRKFFGYPMDVDLAAFFDGVPEFKAAWSHYRYTTRIDRCQSQKPGTHEILTGCRYDIYSRVP